MQSAATEKHNLEVLIVKLISAVENCMENECYGDGWYTRSVKVFEVSQEHSKGIIFVLRNTSKHKILISNCNMQVLDAFVNLLCVNY